MLVFVAAGLADPPPGTGFMFTLQSLAKMMMMGVMIMRDDVCGLEFVIEWVVGFLENNTLHETNHFDSNKV